MFGLASEAALSSGPHSLSLLWWRGVLKRGAFCFERLHELLGQCAGNKATHSATSRNAPDSTVRFQ